MTQTQYCDADRCMNEAIVGITLCEQHAEECTCTCADCERRGVHYCHAEDGSDYGEGCKGDVSTPVNPVRCHGCGETIESTDANFEDGEPWCDACYVAPDAE